MKIIERNNERKREATNDEFKFDNGAWVRIYIGENERGSWEYQSDEEDEETYSEGGLWFEDKWLADYDGCYGLPEEVIMAIKELGYKIDL